MPEHVAPLSRNLLDAISSAGIDVARLAKTVGLTSSKLERGVTYAESDRFLTAALEAIGDPAFGLVIGTAIKPELYSVVGFSALTGPTVVAPDGSTSAFELKELASGSHQFAQNAGATPTAAARSA